MEPFDDECDVSSMNTKSLLLDIRCDVKQMNRKFDSMKKSVEEIKKDNKMLKSENVKLRDEVDILTSKLNNVETLLSESSRKQEYLEKQNKIRNLKIFNIPHTEGETSASLEKKIAEEVQEQLEIPENEISIEQAYRLPSKVIPKPILVKCSDLKIKERILNAFRAKRKYNGSALSFRIGEDLPERISKARSDLFPFFQQCRDNKKEAYFKHDYLVVEGQKYVFDKIQNRPVLVTK